ncbi:MAG TPA: nuclear transport factor 2 family protein [Actinomycetes bacterium]|nr:nuclear transport factor 2 family protein [Actinomycetes bacterium]
MSSPATTSGANGAVREVDGGTADAAEAVVAALVSGDTDRYLAVCAPDVLLDLVVPMWRFQLSGHDGLREALAGEFLPGRRVNEQHVTPTSDGVLVELEAEGLEDGQPVKWWTMHHIRIDGDRVVEHIAHCSGMLDQQQMARQAAEAPMVRAR